MGIYYIDGVASSGKSTTLEALRNLGYEAYDVDEAGPATAKWHHNVTGYIHPKSSVKAADRTPDFLAAHSWKVPRPEVEALAQKAVAANIFIGGAIDNKSELQDLFSAVFALVIDDATVAERLASRTNNDWGKSPHELKDSLADNRQAQDNYEAAGYIIIDGSQPTDLLARQILSHIHEADRGLTSTD